MKRMSYFVMALALVLGFTQCKKEQTPTNNETEGVFIILDVNGGNSNSRVIVDPVNYGINQNDNTHYATVAYEDGDVIYVGYKVNGNNALVGTLTYGGEEGNKKFSGSVNIPEIVEGEYLHFYFLGGNGFTPSFDGNTATVNISDQTSKYPVISYAPSNEEYMGAATYSAKLMNKCSIMKFNVVTPSSSPICIMGMNNKVTVNFATPNGTHNGFTYDMDGVGEIKMHSSISGNGTETPYEMWAIVLPQTETGDARANMAYTSTLTKGNYYTGDRPALSIDSNVYYDTYGDYENGVDLFVNIPPKYSVSSSQQVEFAPANLQYKKSEGWSFMEHQYSYSEVEGLNDEIYGYANDELVTLFKWGANGLSTGEKPGTVGDKNSNYTNDLSSDQDWGVPANTANLGGHNNWRTPSMDEWSYVASRQISVLDNNTKELVDTAAYGFAVIDKMKGFILLPDNWNGAIDPDFVYGFDEGHTNIYTTESWQAMEAAGVVFLPAAGYRAAFFMTEFWLVGTYWSTKYGGMRYDDVNDKDRTCAYAFTFSYFGQGYDVDVYESVYEYDPEANDYVYINVWDEEEQEYVKQKVEHTPGLKSEDYNSYTIPTWTSTDWRTWTKPTHNPQPGSYTNHPGRAPDPDGWEADNDFTYYGSSVRLIRIVE